jgi:predicted transcriptional regulator
MQRLTKAEEEIMNLLWEHGESTVSALIAIMDEPRPPHSSISSIVRILEKKEFVDHRPEGRSFVYFPIVAKKDYSRYSLRRLVTNYFDGSMNELVSFLVKEEDLSIKELEAIRNRLQTEEE